MSQGGGGDGSGGADAHGPTVPALAVTTPVEPPRGDGDPAAEPVVDAVVDPAIGTSVGRYRVVARLGAGGMGVVYQARDPALDRMVALKLLPPLAPALRAGLEARLRREAQALARVDHPHVIAVHDVGVSADSVFVAMQFVDGTTLDRYLEAHRPPPRRILVLFAAAGRGLAAAHAAGIVHRDVKPANVLVDRDHRPYVGDFGLARGVDESARAGDGATGGAAEVDVTRTGAIMGTPLFMAPEQHRGEPATARADQFAYCVSLWLALFGAHPFARGRWERAAALDAMAADRVVEPGRRDGVPAAVVRALRRGLRNDPVQRWPSMTELVDAIEPRRRAGWLLGGLTAAGVVGGVVLTASLGGLAGSAPDACANAARPVAAVWSPARRAALAQAFAATAVPYARDLAGRVDAQITARADAWSAMRIATCRAGRRGSPAASADFDRRMACLDRRLVELDATVGALSDTPTADAVDRAAEPLDALPALAACDDLARLGAVEPLPADPAARARVEQVLRDVAQATAALRAGQVAGGVERAAAIVEAARATGSLIAQAQALGLLGLARQVNGDGVGAADAWRDSAATAARAHDDGEAGQALLRVAWALHDAGKDADALLVLTDAEVAVARAGDRPDQLGYLHEVRGRALRRLSRFDESDAALARSVDLYAPGGAATELAMADALQAWGLLLLDRSQFDAARDRLERAVAIFERRLGPDHLKLGAARRSLGKLLLWIDDAAGARRELDAALRIQRARLPADHLSLASTLSLFGSLALRDGQLAEAERYITEGLRILEAKAPDHPDTSSARYELAGVRRQAGKLDESLALYQQVLAWRRARYGERHARVANVLDAMGAVEDLLGKDADALAHLEQALAIREEVVGAATEDVAISLVTIADYHLRRDACGKARPAAARALVIAEAIFPPEHPLQGAPIAIQAVCDRRAGRLDAARAGLERALAIAERSGSAEERVTMRVELARTLAAQGDRAGARRHAQDARDRLPVGPSAARAEIDALLAGLN